MKTAATLPTTTADLRLALMTYSRDDEELQTTSVRAYGLGTPVRIYDGPARVARYERDALVADLERAGARTVERRAPHIGVVLDVDAGGIEFSIVVEPVQKF